MCGKQLLVFQQLLRRKKNTIESGTRFAPPGLDKVTRVEKRSDDMQK